MQNANIKYKIRLDELVYKGLEVEISMNVSAFETEWTIADELYDTHGIIIGGFGGKYYTVIERTIELFNED